VHYACALALRIPERGYFPSNSQAQPTENTQVVTCVCCLNETQKIKDSIFGLACKQDIIDGLVLLLDTTFLVFKQL